jgi:hypothetical protein
LARRIGNTARVERSAVGAVTAREPNGATTMPAARKPPWKRRKPHRGRSSTLSPAAKAEARKRAAKAGRRYPNLIDNMAVARRKRAKRARR